MLPFSSFYHPELPADESDTKMESTWPNHVKIFNLIRLEIIINGVEYCVRQMYIFDHVFTHVIGVSRIEEGEVNDEFIMISTCLIAY